MRLKTLVTSVAVLAVAAIGVYFARRPEAPQAADARVNQPIVDAKIIESAAKLRVSDQGKMVLLTRQSDGTWRVPSYHDMPADFSKLSGFVGNLTDAKVQRLVTSNAAKINRLEFKDTKVELLDSADKVLWSITLGKNAETGGGRFVRFGDEQKAYLTNLSAWIDPEAKNWANSELINLKPEDVAKVEIGFAEGAPVTVSRAKKEDEWKAEGAADKKVKADKVSSVLSSVGNVRFSDTSEPSDPNVAAAKANLRTVKLTTFDNKTVTVAMGRKPEEKKLKPPVASADGKTGPASLGSLTDLAKKDEKKEGDAAKKDDQPAGPEFETIPAGPVYVFITHSDANAPVNALMQKRAFQISEYTFTSLPQKQDELFDAAPPPAPAATTPPAEGKPNTTPPPEKKGDEKK